MTDEKYITKFLDDTYEIRSGISDFYLIDIEKYDDTQIFKHDIYPSDFSDIFYKIFGQFTTVDGKDSIEIFNTWFEDKKRIILKDLFDYLDTIDEGIGGDKNLAKLIDLFEDNSLNDTFITNQFTKFYYRKFMNDKVLDYLTKVDTKKGAIYYYNEINVVFNLDIKTFSFQIIREFNTVYKTKLKIKLDGYLGGLDHNLTSLDLINNFNKGVLEDDAMVEYYTKYLNEWYSVNVLNDKVDMFLRELVITLGRTDWLVTWVGHGKITKDKLLLHFMKEDKYHEKYIMYKYDIWYEQEVIETSEKVMKNNY